MVAGQPQKHFSVTLHLPELQLNLIPVPIAYFAREQSHTCVTRANLVRYCYFAGGDAISMQVHNFPSYPGVVFRCRLVNFRYNGVVGSWYCEDNRH
ncbi:hypothetical protein BaRGS_00022571 [Batillaria attramentaria]|uniref:Uncharacterized protein n=1 Tax=Batillaria attramentaria TaxID=370345 RepID=A0ABD0KG75_9CAEN